MAAFLEEGEDDLSRSDLLTLRGGETLCNGNNLGAVEEQGDTTAVVAEGRVGSEVDVVLGVELDELLLLETGVALDLVDSRGDTGVVDDGLELLLIVVRDTNGANLGLGQLSEGCGSTVSFCG